SIPQRQAGVMVATEPGMVTAYALDGLYDRGFFFVKPGEQVYEGQIVGEHVKDTDIPVNPTKQKQLTNMRTSSKDDAAKIRPARELSLEAALEYIQEDELVEITPTAIRIRKRQLKENDRRRASRKTS
ncbi:MAG TPA: translational GTPase TypA, partial [Methylococcales bacterium]